MIIPARFAHCPSCGRLIIQDGSNPLGRCTKDCGGRVDTYPVDREVSSLLDGLAVAHHCPDPDACSFGNEGCHR